MKLSEVYRFREWKDELPGGRADRRRPRDFDPKELRKGAEDEHGEHTSSWHKAKEIAMDHLVDNPDYYTDMERGVVEPSGADRRGKKGKGD